MGTDRRVAGIPENPVCANCGVTLDEPFGWCSMCVAAYCQECRRAHYCHEGCQASGCIAGLCVRTVENGVLGGWRKVDSE
jgi:hypothetical protein